jgi:hypothetical protein
MEKMLHHLSYPFEDWAMATGNDSNMIYEIEEWPESFDINNEEDVPPIPLAKFKDQP